MIKILLIEDNMEYRAFLDRVLTKEGYDVTIANNAIFGLEALAKQRYDLLITDLNLDVMDGIRLITVAREIDPTIKTMILTGEPANASEIAALEIRVDYYVEKNRSIDIILAYIEKMFKEDNESLTQVFIFYSPEENIELNVKAHSVLKDGIQIDLTPKEFEVLRIFLANKNTVITREEMVRKVWQDEIVSDASRVVDVHIQKLREKLNTYLILTVRGKGYKWYE